MSEKHPSVRARVLAEVCRAYEQRVMNNVHRSDYVEAIVAVALADYGWTRKDPWEGWDCEHTSGVPLEVKPDQKKGWGRYGAWCHRVVSTISGLPLRGFGSRWAHRPRRFGLESGNVDDPLTSITITLILCR